MKTSRVKKLLTESKEQPVVKKYLRTGSSVLDVHLSGTNKGGYRSGKYYALVGDSSSGKTWLCFTAFAEAKLNPAFADYRLIYDSVEDGADMDVAHFFGQTVADALEPPAGTAEDPVYSRTAEDFDFHLNAAMKDGRPFIYVLDSIDGLSTEADEEKDAESRKARTTGKKVTGSYGMSKAKKLKAILRLATSTDGLRKSGSILIVLCQTIDNVGFGFETKDRAGGNAVTFFATADVWLSVKKTITKPVKGKDRPVGITTHVVIKKNRITGRRYEKLTLPILYSVGIDDTGGCVDYLVEEGYWKGGKGGIVATGISDDHLSRDALVRHIEDNDLEKTLRIAVRKCYDEISEATKVVRKPRYL